jgi:CubicO group peptidase (beta-lactamase class C family)
MRIAIKLLAMWAVAMLAMTAAVAQPALAEAERARIDALFVAPAAQVAPGYAVGVVKDGQLVFAHGYGLANLDDGTRITPRTAFHLASLSKQFTAAAVALLILDGRLSLETPATQFFPELTQLAPQLRVKHLVYFTSGLRDYTSLPRSSGQPWFTFQYFTIDEALQATLSSGSLKFQPGTQWDYSNINYMLLARIVEKVSGMPLSDFLERRMFSPLAMADSRVDDDTTQVIPRRATGYAERSNEAARQELAKVGVTVRPGAGYMRLPRVSPHYGGSGVFSTVEDLARWSRSFDTHALAGPAFVELMLRRERFQHPKDNDAFGLVHGDFRGRPMVWFSGADLDASTFMARLPADGLTVICLSNNPFGDAEGKARAVLDVLLPSVLSR